MKVILFFNLFCVLFLLVNGTSISDFTTGNHIFTSDFYQKLKTTEKGNFLISPFSAEVVLALTQSGAKDQTGEEIRSSLHLPNSDEATKSGLQAYFSSLKKSQYDEYQLYSANKIYLKKNLTLKENFKQVATSVYGAEIENVDFSQKEKTAKAINQWVEKQTQNKIQNLVEPQSLQENTEAVLINSLYFKGRWLNEFYNESTKKSNFYRSSTDVVKVDTMFKLEEFNNYFQSQELKAKFLELPFRASDVSFIIVLPNEKEGLSELETKSEVFTKKQFRRELVNLALPKFKIESKVDVKKILQSLGVSTLFSNEADLSGIAGEKGELKVDEVIQKSFIDVNEEGVEAAAATLEGLAGSAFTRDPPKEFIVDHPFIFYIEAKGAILFAGRVVDPSK